MRKPAVLEQTANGYGVFTSDLWPKNLTDNANKACPDLSKLERFRVTGVQSFHDCPARWAEEMRQGSEWKPPSLGGRTKRARPDYARIGTEVHGVCEAVLKKWFDPENPSAWTSYEAVLTRYGVNPEERDNCLAYCVQLKRWMQTVQPLGVESELCWSPAVGSDLPLAGHLDIIGWDVAERVLVIRDHKTNRSVESADEWATKLQPRFYAWMLGMLTGWEFPIRYEIGYVNRNTVVSWIVEPEPDGMLPLIFSRTVAAFSTFLGWDTWPERVNPYCNTCPRFQDCGAAAGMLQEFALLAEQGDPRDGKGGSLLQRYAWTKAVLDCATTALELLRDEVAVAANDAGGELVDPEAGLSARLTVQNKRSAAFSAVYKAVLEDLKNSPKFRIGEGEYARYMAEFDTLFTVKLGALDRYCRDRPELATALVGVISSSEADAPTLVVKKSSQKKG
jgi:PD-(D/E)XK nuclease superfamily protein